MMVTIYVDFENEEVYSKKEYEETISEMADDGLKNIYDEYCADFNTWCNDYYSPAEVFAFTEEDKNYVINKYKEYAEDAIRSSWKCEEKEIEI